MISREEQIEDRVRERLLLNELYPQSVFFTYEIGNGLLAITVIEGFDRLLGLLGYKEMCDRSGFDVFEPTNTVVLTGLPLIKLFYDETGI